MDENKEKVIKLDDYLTSKQQKDVLKFITLLAKLEPLELIGVSQILGIEIVTIDVKAEGDKVLANATANIAENIISESIDAFLQLNRQQRKNLFKILRQCR